MTFNVKALHLSTHQKITEIAVKEFFSCLGPAILSKENEKGRKLFENILIEANLKEDTDYLRKALQYSHFYNPNFSVNAEWMDIDRCSSDYRVQHIEYILREYYLNKDTNVASVFRDDACHANAFYNFFNDDTFVPQETSQTIKFEFRNDIREIHPKYLEFLGSAVHHIQDMSSPTHVVPIMHPRFFGRFYEPLSHDAFENYVFYEVQMEYENTPRDCNFKTTPPDSLLHILNTSAQRALQSFEEEISVVVNNSPTTVTWTKWYDITIPPDDNGMRDYGIYENTFGLTEFHDRESNVIKVDKVLYDTFAYTKYREAVNDTKKAIYYFWMFIQESNF